MRSDFYAITLIKNKTMSKEQNVDYVEVVSTLNVELYERHKEVESYFEYRTTGFADLILFDEFLLWSSENDIREFDEDKNDYEPFMPFIKKQFNQIADKMQKIRF
jgi:hypothetical protein